MMAAHGGDGLGEKKVKGRVKGKIIFCHICRGQ